MNLCSCQLIIIDMENPFETFAQDLTEIKDLLYKISEPKEEEVPQHYTVKETAVILKCSEQSIHNYIKKGFLSAQKVGRILLIKSEDVQASLQDVKSLKYRR